MGDSVHASQAHAKPMLIFDKEGSLGGLIAKALTRQNLCVFVTASVPEKMQQLVYVPWKKKIPTIPNSAFSLFYLVYSPDSHLLDMLPAFIKKAKEDKTHIFFLINIRDATTELLQKVLESSSVVTVVLIGDMFDGDIFRWSNPVTDILTQAKQGSVVLPNWGLPHVYPVHMDDVLHVLVATANRKDFAQTRLVHVLPPHPVTMLSFGRTLAKQEPLLQIDFSDAAFSETYTPTHYVSVFGEYNYESRLPLMTFTPGEPTPIPHAPSVYTKKKRKVLRMPSFRISALSWFVIVTILSLFLLSPVFASLIGAGLLYRTKEHVATSNYENAKTTAKAAKQFFYFAEVTSPMITSPLHTVGLGRVSEAFSDAITTGEQSSDVAVHGIDGFTQVAKVLAGTSLDPKNEFVQGVTNIKHALITVGSLRAEKKIPDQYISQAEKLERVGTTLTNTYDVLPTVFGMNGARTYLVLFQNNMELRPGGGFIGSYAVITVDKGQLGEVIIQDVYDADGQLKEHVEPPFQLKRYLGSQHWFLRDSNFDVDFSKSAAMAAYFYNLEMGKKIDGVIAVDVSFVQKLIEALGPISLPEYNATVTSSNFFLLTESHVQNNFFPGSTQKKDFLRSVYNQVFLRLTEHKAVKYDALLNAIITSLYQKHLLLAFPDKKTQQVFSANGLSSTLADARETGPSIFNGIVGISDANIGANKSNYYVSRSIKHTVALMSDNTIKESVSVTYTNKSKKNSEFGGDYKNYVRFIVPKDAQLVSLAFDGIEQTTAPAVTDPAVFNTKAFTPPAGIEVERSDQDGKTLFGFFMTVPSGTKKEVTITYTTPVTIMQYPTSTYSLRIFKQPGATADPYLLSFTYPGSYAILKKSPGLRVDGKKVTFITDLSEDRTVSLQMTKR